MALIARYPGAACIFTCGGMAVSVAGDDAVRALIQRSRPWNEAWIPGCVTVGKSPGRRVHLVCRIEPGRSHLPRAAFTARPPALCINGDVSLLTPEAFAELMLSLFARFLQRRGSFLVDGSVVRLRGEVVMLTSPAGADRSAAALQLARQGHEILATNRSLLSKDMRLLAGTTAFHAGKQGGRKLQASLTADGPPVIMPLSRKYPAISRIVHLHLEESTSAPREIDRPKRKLVMSSNVVSRLAAGPAVVAPWGLFLPLVTTALDVRRRHEAILNMAGLPQASLYCRPEDLEVMLEKIS